MKFIQTLYNEKSKDFFSNNFGWLSPEFHLMSWALSSLQLNKINKQNELYASSQVAKILIDTLGLPYDELHVTHDNFYLPDKRLWALSKIHTYSLQEKPFLHIDGDVFIFSKFSTTLLKGKLIAQNLEEATHYYTTSQQEIMNHFSFLPSCVKNDFESTTSITAVNAGILGGSDIEFISEYAEKAKEYVQKNEKNLGLINADRFNVFFEQHLFYSMAKEKNIPIKVFINDRVKDNEYNDLSNFHEISYKKNYLHLLGHYKRDEFTCIQMAATLRELYAEYYYKVISLCKKKQTETFFSCHEHKNQKSLKKYLKNKKNAQKSYIVGFLKEKNKDTQNVSVNNELSIINKFIDGFKVTKKLKFSKAELEGDFTNFSNKLNNILIDNYKISNAYLYGRDLDSIHWYPNLFKNEYNLDSLFICKCEEITVFTSRFDWTRVLKSFTSEGRQYYADVEIFPDKFYNLIVPEVYSRKYTLFDIDEMEHMILEHLNEPISVKNLLIQMQIYVEPVIIENHLSDYNRLLITLLKQLVLKKAIKPFKNILE